MQRSKAYEQLQALLNTKQPKPPVAPFLPVKGKRAPQPLPFIPDEDSIVVDEQKQKQK